MKTKNVVLGLSAILFAVGGTFASSILLPATYIKPSGVCRQITQIECGQAGQIVCQAHITAGMPTGNFPAYKDLQDCEDGVVVTTTTAAPRNAAYVN
jgi:hypothetical protein